MADVQPITRPFPNGGLQLKNDVALLDESHYSELTNMVSIKEGVLSIRPGNQKITGLLSFANASAIHSIASLRIEVEGSQAQATETFYIGEGQNIWAKNTTASGWTTVATSCAPTVSTGMYPRQSLGAASYSAGSSGLPYEYFACPSRMLKDNGTLPALQQWGILRPSQPAIAEVGPSTLVPDGDLVHTPGGGVLAGLGNVGSFTGTAPGNFVITPTLAVSLNLIKVGMLLEIGATPQYANVLSMTTTTFTVYLATAPTAGDAISYYVLESFASGTNQSITISPVTVDGSFSGIPSNGYSTDDPVHFGLAFSSLSNYTAVEFRVLVNGSSTDYYKIVIIDPTNIAGSVAKYNLQTNVQMEFSIPKSTFIAVGNAGTVPYSWKSITGFQLVWSMAGGGQIDLDSVYLSGGYGPNTNSSTSSLLPYTYVYTFRNPITGAEGNPSVEMISSAAVYPQNQTVNVACLGTGDSQITGANSIAVYRSGGAFSDDYYRFVGYAANPGAGQLVTFIDQQSDATLLEANTADFDNDAPVTSTLPTPLIMESSTPAINGAMATLTVTTSSGNLAALTVGSNATVAINTSIQETAVVAAVNVTASTIALFLQYEHSDAVTNPFTIEVDEVAGQPATLCLAAFDSMFVAGDPNNPHVLYMSKPGRPEAFPILNFTTNIPGAINVGTPSNYIVALAEYNGGVLCLNLNNIFYVRVISGVMESPIATPAQRGLLAKNAWCQSDNEIWYLSYDGIYSWSGGASQLRSLDIDPLFKGYNVGAYQAIDTRPNLGNQGADVITMAFSQNEVFVSYLDVSGNPCRLRYHTLFNRWSIEQQTDPIIAGATPCMVTAQYLEKTTGILYIAKNPNSVAHLYIDNVGTSDGWSEAFTGGAPISYAFVPAALTMNAPSVNKTFADVALEYAGLTTALSLDCFYDYADTTNHPAAGDTFTIVANGARGRAVVSLQGGYQKEAYAMQTRFYGSSTYSWAFYSMTVNVIPLTQIQVGRAYDWDDLGYPYDKKLYQLVMEYDIPVGQTVVMNMDSITGLIGTHRENTAVQSFTLTPPTTTTVGTPNRITANFAFNDGTVVKKVRLRPSVTTVPFKHFSYSFPEFTKYPADICLFTEWNTEGHPYQKELQTLELEMNTGGVDCIVQTQGDGVNIGPAFTVNTTLDTRMQMMSYPPDLTAKNLRLVFTPGIGGYAQHFGHKFGYIPYPPDSQQYAEWSDLGYPGDKVLRTLNLEMNTNGQPCLVQVQGDGVNLGSPLIVTTTFDTRAQILTLESDLIAKLVRLSLTPSSGGVAQYFKHSFDFWKEPLAVTHWDSYEFNFGYNGYNFVKQAWLEYACPNEIFMTFYGDYGKEFYSVTLPAHPQRDVERFYLPDYTLVAGSNSLNKSKRKRITIDSTEPIIDLPRTGVWMAYPTQAASTGIGGNTYGSSNGAVNADGTVTADLVLTECSALADYSKYPSALFSGFTPPPIGALMANYEWLQLRCLLSLTQASGINGFAQIRFEPGLVPGWDPRSGIFFSDSTLSDYLVTSTLESNPGGDGTGPSLGYHDDLGNTIVGSALSLAVRFGLGNTQMQGPVSPGCTESVTEAAVALYYDAIRLNCGSAVALSLPQEIYPEGHFTFAADNPLCYSGGTAQVLTTPETTLYCSRRHGTFFQYTFGPGLFSDYYIETDYNVTLYFIDPVSTGMGQNVFTVTINEVVVGTLDVFSLADGANKPYFVTYPVEVVGKANLVIAFAAITGEAMCSGIRVAPVVGENMLKGDYGALPFKVYADGSRLEWMACGSDQRSSYQQSPISSPMHPSIGGGE